MISTFEAEQMILGASLTNTDAMAVLASMLQPDDMSDGRHALIYRAMLARWNKRTAPDYILVLAELRATNDLETVGQEYLSNLYAPGGIPVQQYAQLVKDASTERQLRDVLMQAFAIADDTRRTLPEKLAAVQEQIMRIAVQSSGRKDEASIGQLISQRLERLRTKQTVPGLPTGIASIDRFLGGIAPGDYVVIGSRPGVGKSSFAKSLGMHMAEHVGPVVFYSREMSDEEIELRYTAEKTGIDSTKIRRGLLSREEFAQIERLAQDAQRVPFLINDVAVTMADIRARTLRRQAMHGKLAAVFVDYLQLVRPSGRYAGNRVQEVGEVSRALKELNMELQVPVFAMAQLNRSAESTADGTPMLSHLREAGDIEQDANQVWFLHRESLYKKDAPAHAADLIIAKNRNGPTGTIPLHWDGPTMSYKAVAYRESRYDRD